MEVKKQIFRRVPPGDRWVETERVEKDRLFNSLTDALEHYFQKTGIRQYYIDAAGGAIYKVVIEEDVIPPPPMFSIYGDF